MTNELTLIVGNWKDGLDEYDRQWIDDMEAQIEARNEVSGLSLLERLVCLLDAYDEIMPDLVGDPA